MLELDVVIAEAYDEQSSKFVPTRQRVQLEHSLASMSKWESSFEKPFLGPDDKKHDEMFAYIEMMILGPKPPPEVLLEIIRSHHEDIQAYINRPMSATKITELQKASGRRETITSELIYSWMVSMTIPFETQHWHLNRLITLIRVINLKNSPKKKMSAAERQQLNRQRLAQSNSRG
jgi:hypothetical protein